MGLDNRDWYRDWWRKKTGYAERASFRISEGEHGRQKNGAAWRRNFYILLAIVFAAVIIRVLRRFV